MKEHLQIRINFLQSILNNHKKKPFLSHNGIIIETVISELKDTLKLTK